MSCLNCIIIFKVLMFVCVICVFNNLSTHFKKSNNVSFKKCTMYILYDAITLMSRK